jgi:hypothetical protein
LAISRRTRSTLGALLASTLMLTGAASAQADPIITSPEPGAYINDTTPTVQFSDVTPGMVGVKLEVGGIVVGTTPDADITAGAGEVTADTSVSAPDGDNDRRVNLVVREDDGTPTNLAFDDVQVFVNQVPSLTLGPADNTVAWSAEEVEYHVTDAIPFNDVVMYSDGHEVAREQADVDGTVTNFKPVDLLSPGPHVLTVVSVDDALVKSSPETVNLTVSPSVPKFEKLLDQAQLNQSQPAINFTDVDPAADKVTLYEVFPDEVAPEDQFVSIGETTDVNSDGTATVTPDLPLSAGEHTVLARQTVNGTETDDYHAGNTWTRVTVNTTAPTLSSNDDGQLTSRIPYIEAEGALRSPTGDNTASVKFYVNGVYAGSDQSSYEGYAYFHPETLADGSYTVYAVTVDDLGHESTARSNEVTFTLDATAPGAPTLVSPANGSVIGTSIPQVTVTGEPGTRVHIIVDYVGEEGDLIVDANGNATFTLTQALADGAHALSAVAVDAAGNWGETSYADFTVKTAVAVPPTPPVVTPPVVTPTPTATPTAPTKVSLSSSTLTAKTPVTVGFTLKKAGTVKVTITKTVKGKTVTVATVNVKVKKAGKGTYTLKTKVGGKTLKKGSYEVSLQTVNGKKKSKSVSAKVSVR